MLTFNLLLKEAGISPKDVYLVRHQDSRVQGRSVYSVYKSDPMQFDLYQKIQGRDCFKKRPVLASFVVPPSGNALFIGLYSNLGHDVFPAALRQCPLSRARVDPLTHFFYRLEPDPRLGEFKDRLSIDWGPGYHSWVQKADSKESGDKQILEFSADVKEESFPGYREFRAEIAEIPSLLPSWQQALRQIGGVYLLTCKTTGKQYVGKADGEDGFWGRFLCYSTTGDGGNEGIRKHPNSGYYVTILDALATAVPGELDRLESLWKDKLGTRLWGLNEN